MKKTKDITREDEVTKDMVPSKEVVQTFNFPTLNISVEAKNLNEALAKVKGLIKDNK